MKNGSVNETAALRRIPWWLLGVFLVAALGLWHMKNVRAGVLESKDTFLYGWYALLLVCVVLAAVLIGWLFFRRRAALETVFFPGHPVPGIHLSGGAGAPFRTG